jgi:hypothetical protein
MEDKMGILKLSAIFALWVLVTTAAPAAAWYEETHLAIAKTSGYAKWYNAAAADIAKAKMGVREGHNHYHMSPHGTVITPEMVLGQARKYDRIDPDGHLYGAIIASLRDYLEARAMGRFAENQMAYLIHYVGDLSMPLHHSPSNAFSRKNHAANDGIIEHEVLANLDKIRIYDLSIGSERDLAVAVARIANLSKALGQKLEKEDRLMTREEAYAQISHSASLLKAILRYTRSLAPVRNGAWKKQSQQRPSL